MTGHGTLVAGVFPARYIERLKQAGGIVAPTFDADQVQPASLDLRLGDVAYRVLELPAGTGTNRRGADSLAGIASPRSA